MSDKDDKKREQEKQRERDMDAEIFGKTMGFVYAKDSKKFEDMTTLEHAHAPGLNREEEDYQATVRFASPKAMAQSSQPKPAAPQAARPTPPQPAKPAAPQAARPTPPQPAKPAAPSMPEPADMGAALSLDELDEFLLPTELEETAGEPVAAKPAEPAPAAEGLDMLDLSELDASFLEEVDTSAAAPIEPARPVTREEDDLLAALDELASETAELEREELLESEKPKAPAAPAQPDLDLETGDFTALEENAFLFGEATPETANKVLLTQADELPESAADLEANEFMIEEPSPAVTEDSISRESPFQDQYEEEEEVEAIKAAERDFITTKPDDLTEAPARHHAPEPVAAVAQPAAKRGGSGFAIFLALLGIAAAGGVGWLTLQTMDRIDQLESRVAALSGRAHPDAANARQDQSIDALQAKTADLEQQLGTLTGVVSDLAAKNSKHNAPRPAPKPAKPKPAPAPTPAPTQSAAPAAAGATAGATDDWVINLTSVASESAALDEVQQLKAKGVEAEAVRVEIDGKPWYRIRTGHFPSEEAAKAGSDELSRQLGIHDAWVSHR